MSSQNPFPYQQETSVIDALYRISRTAGSTDDYREALQLILNELQKALGASSASLSLVSPDTGMLEIEVYQGLPPESARICLGLGEGVTGWVALHGQPLLVREVNTDPRYVAVKEDIACEMAAPMIIEGLVVGVVNVDSVKKNAFDDSALKLLTLMTNEATRTISRLWFVQQLKEKANQLEALISSGRRLVSKRDLLSILQQIAKDSRTVMGYRMAAIFLMDEAGREMQLHTVAGLDDAEFTETLDPGESSIGVAVRRRKQVAVYDLPRTEEHHFIKLVQDCGLRSMLATPIVFEEQVIGLLNVYTDRPHRFNNEEKRILESLASLGAVAITNSRLYSRIFKNEDLLRKNEQLTTLGLLSSEIAHEIRNPLTTIKLLFDSLDLRYPQEDERNQDVRVIREKLHQLEEIVGRVLSFGKTRNTMHARYDLNKLIADTLLLARLKIEQNGCALEFRPLRSPLFVEVHKGQIQQVVLNLVINALQAMNKGGTVIVRTQRNEADDSQAELTVTDTGCGIEPDMQDRLFEPFLTAGTGGAGLGLSISKRIMHSHRGRLDLVKTSDSGTTFRVILPLAD